MKRHEQKIEDTWNLKMMYDPSNLDADIKECNKIVEEIKKYNSLTFTKNEIIDALNLYYKLMIKIENIYVYFSHQQDSDFSNDKYVSILNKVKGEYNNMSIEVSFLMPKIANVDNSILESIINDSKLKEYHQTIVKVINNKKRYLSGAEERIISTYGLNSNAAYQLYSAFTNSDLKFENIFDSNNNQHEMSEGSYSTYIRSSDRVLRKNAYNNLFDTYGKYNQTLATNYISEMKQDLISMKTRNYASTLQQALEPNEIPEYVYHNLLNSVENNIKANHDYLNLRKKEMKLKELHLYDIYTSMVDEVDKKVEYHDAKEIVKEALSIFPNNYTKVLNEALENRWIDVYENEGKRSGAYSGGSYTSVPYMLLNYHNELNDVFTLAHELGHSMHSYFANNNNPYQDANYKIFIAEVASTVNELILINHLLEKEDDSKIRKYLYNYLLEQFRTTLVRQTMFARFELESHKLVEKNEEISNEVLNNLYYDINKLYFGKDIILDENIKYEWSRIPHFYYDYYVYQYATSFSISLNIVDRILNNEKGIIDKYIKFLSLGDSVYPIDALKEIDIDLSTSKVFDSAMKKYADTILKFELEN
ncbi:oligoendopeptidase F [Mycoplasma sp. P36-A1]|uniref:oligoendopeptidase F n=1 Tax=Mycoplasma sp. P36-A1 TaxID=3252900 RepID=UPI003C3035E1